MTPSTFRELILQPPFSRLLAPPNMRQSFIDDIDETPASGHVRSCELTSEWWWGRPGEVGGGGGGDQLPHCQSTDTHGSHFVFGGQPDNEFNQTSCPDTPGSRRCVWFGKGLGCAVAVGQRRGRWLPSCPGG